MTCEICGHHQGEIRRVCERMFGFGDEFDYFECATCGCLQLLAPPADLWRYYPPTYYSFSPPGRIEFGKPPGPWARRLWGRSRIGFLWKPRTARGLQPAFRSAFRSIVDAPGLSFDSRILDVGCGNGLLLVALAELGFRDLTGVDPYLRAPLNPGEHVRLLAASLEDVDDGPYDLVMFNHSLEHIHHQFGVLAAARRLLRPGGTCLVRIPTVSSAPWRRFRAAWAELDAPRHLYLHSHRSLRLVAEHSGFLVTKLWCDSDAFGYWASELYQRGLPLRNAETGKEIDVHSHFGADQLDSFQRQAELDNRRLDGGRVSAWLSPLPS